MNQLHTSSESGPDAGLESRLRHLDRLANAGTLAASMAHEIKNALVAVQTFVDLLLERNQDAELAEVVRREMARIDSLVGRMLKFSSPSVPHFTPVHVHEVLEHSIRLVQPQVAAKALVLNRSFEGASDKVDGNLYELQHAFLNLLLNAIEATAANGVITVSTRAVGAAAGAPGELTITVADTGEGILATNMSRLFEPFFTTKPNGTGLGLAVTRRVVSEHGGTISAQSQPGQGTTFTITLPLSPDGSK